MNYKNYKQLLRKLELDFACWMNTGFGDRNSGLSDANLIMQEMYPGPYTVVEKYDIDRAAFSFELNFSDPKEETFWLLKHL